MRIVVGWLMLLLGAVVLTGAVADSKVGAWLRAPSAGPVPVSLTDIDRISLRADRLHVFVDAIDRPDLAVIVRGSHAGWVDAQVLREGSELQVWVSAPWWHRPHDAEPTFVEVHVPQNFAEALRAEIGEGSLTVSGISPDRPAAWKELVLEARTARVHVRHLQVGMLKYSGQTGALFGEWVQAGEADLRQVTGQVDLAHFTGPLRVDMTTGRVGAQFDALAGPVAVKQVKGQLQLDLPADAAFTLDASVGRGISHEEWGLQSVAGAGRTALRGTVGAGTHAVDLRVETGEITLR